MVRYGERGVLFIDTGVEKKKCGDGKGDHAYEIWDDEMGGCLKLLSDNTSYRLKDLSEDKKDKLFADNGSYKLDRLETYRNAYDCWVDNNGKIGDPEVPDSPTDTSLPKCFFGIDVVKGTLSLGTIKMDEFPGQTAGEPWEDYHDRQEKI